MKCEYTDGLEVDYAGSLRISKGEGVNVYFEASQIPANIKGELDAAAQHNSCGELRRAAKDATYGAFSEKPEW